MVKKKKYIYPVEIENIANNNDYIINLKANVEGVDIKKKYLVDYRLSKELSLKVWKKILKKYNK